MVQAHARDKEMGVKGKSMDDYLAEDDALFES